MTPKDRTAMQHHRVMLLAAAPMLAAWLALSPAPAAPLVGLCGQNYRAFYSGALEQAGAQAQLLSGADLANPDVLKRCQALIIVTNADMAQQDAGLPPEADAAVAAYVAGGGRVLCTFGCAPPKAVLSGSFDSPGAGSDWFVSDNQHPLTAGLTVGQMVRYKAYRYRVSDLGPQARVLLREADGSPAVTVVAHGQGLVIQTCGDLAATADGDGTTRQLLARVLRVLLYGQVQARFGAALPPEAPAPPAPPQVRTPRVLALPAGADGTVALSRSFRGGPVPPARDGYALAPSPARQPTCWSLHAPPGRQRFAPWLQLPLGAADIKAGLTYRLTVRARLAGLGPGLFAPAQFELRFFDPSGAELPHVKVATPEVPLGPAWQDVSCQDVAPAGAVRATMSLTAMLPTGRLDLDQLRLAQVRSPDEIFAAETPLAGRVAGHPRVFLTPAQAAALPQWVGDTRPTPFGCSRADLFQKIRARADGYLTETEIKFGDQALPWPPVALPQEGGGLSWNPLATAIGDRLASLSLAYAGTGDEKYGRRATALLTALARWPQWYDPVNGTPGLDIGYIAFAAAMAYDLAFPLLSADERRLVQGAMRRNVLLPLYALLAADMHDTNGYALWTTVLGLCATATLGEVPGAASSLRLAEDRLLVYWDERANTHRSEGQGYDAWAYGLQLALADALQRNFGAGHLDHPFLRVLAPFATSFLAGDRGLIAWFADSGGSAQYVPWDFPLTVLAARNRDGLAGWYLRETKSLPYQDYDFVKLLYLDPNLPVTEPDPARPGAVFPRVGWAALRSGWERGGTLIALQCSSANQGHSHQDQNNVLIYRNAEALAMDCGYASALQGAPRAFARGAVGHNTILVDGQGQIANRGCIPFFATSRAVDYAMGDASAAYTAALLQRFHRHLVYLKPDLLLMVDDLRAAGGARSFQWLLHPHSWGPEATVTRDGAPLVVGAPAAPGTVEIARKGEKLRVRFLNPSGVGVRVVTYPGAESYRAYLQADTPPAAATVLVTLIEMGDTKADAVELKLDGGLVDFSCGLSGARTRVKLRLVGDKGEPPGLTVRAGQKTLLDKRDLAVPANTPG